MVLGWDEERPKERNYNDFVRNLISGLTELGQQGVSLMLYGSYVRGDTNIGRSDIDAILIFPDDVIIDKPRLNIASNALATALNGNNVPFQVTLADLTTMREGTFNPFEPNFKGYFKKEGKIVLGPDYRNSFIYSLPIHSDQTNIRFNLRKSRLGLLFFEHLKSKDYRELLNRFNKTLDAVSRASKQIPGMIDGELRASRFSALEVLPKLFPELDISSLYRIRSLYHNLEELDDLYRNQSELEKVWKESVTFFESLVKSYLEMRTK